MRLSRWVPSIACISLAVLAGCAAPPNGASSVREPGAITLSTDHADLAAGFRWARETSLGYVREDDPVGPWYEAALPGRDAFCMRDVSHQVEGSLALGLYEHTFNMMRKFAGSIAESRDWCGYWEIDRLDRPAPVDYRSDDDFWYNLPANFDVVQAALRAWEWTGDEAWLEDPLLDEFYRRSMTDYIARWDSDGDGIVDSPESAGIRGIPTYWEGDGPRAATGGDLVGAQYFGTCRETGAGTWRFDLDLHIGVPATLVTDGTHHHAGEHIPISLEISADDLGRPVTVKLPGGRLQLTIDRIGELPTT